MTPGGDGAESRRKLAIGVACALAAAAPGTALAWLTSCAPHLDLGWNDAGQPDSGDCRLGAYGGHYMCESTQASPFPFATGGTIAVVLAFADASTPDGSLPIILAPGSQFASSGAGALTGTLSGTLDCAGRTLSGSLGNVLYTSSSFNTMVRGTGPLSATYVPDAGEPALLDGVFAAPPFFGGASATCTWSATLR
jgi:hypothetical protein